MSDEQTIIDFYAPYDEISHAVVSDPTPRAFAMGSNSHVTILEFILEVRGLDALDIFGEVDWQGVYESGDRSMILAHYFHAYFLYTVCDTANRMEVGDTAFSQRNFVLGEYWCQKLLDLLFAIDSDGEVKHNWIH